MTLSHPHTTNCKLENQNAFLIRDQAMDTANSQREPGQITLDMVDAGRTEPGITTL